jgi:hypothetical protein
VWAQADRGLVLDVRVGAARVLRSAEAGLGPSGAALALAGLGVSAQGASFVTLELP